MNRKALTEEDKINIIKKYELLGPKWQAIGRILSINPNTCKSFMNSYKKHGTIFPKMGRPVEITQELKNQVIDRTENDPEISLRDLANIFDICPASVRKVLHEDKIQYFQKIAVPPLTPAHMLKRVQFASQFAQLTYRQMPSLIFTDESTVEVNLKGGGIWRRKGEYPPGSFYEKTAHPISCMVWGAIGPLGFRTTLIKVNGRLNAEGYIRLLNSNLVPHQIFNRFGDNFIFQQDNARPHCARRIQPILNAMFPNRLDWPAKSPDLSPIEQIWDYIKGRIAGEKFTTADQLFTRLKTEWEHIPDEVIHNCYSSFLARCRVCIQIQGQNLNGHWNEVHKIHDTYRTTLRYQPVINGFIPYEV